MKEGTFLLQRLGVRQKYLLSSFLRKIIVEDLASSIVPEKKIQGIHYGKEKKNYFYI